MIYIFEDGLVLGEVMRRFLLAAMAALVFSFSSGEARASGDSSCYPNWRVSHGELGCASIPAISPGNDTRVNLLLLTMDGPAASAKSYPELGWDRSYGRNFFDWSLMRQAYAPRAKQEDYPDNFGTRCQSFDSGTKQFNVALRASPKVSEGDRLTLRNMRAFLSDICENRDYRRRAPDDLTEIATNAASMLAQISLGSKAAHDFLTYLKAANRFYAGNYDRALEQYGALKNSKAKWVRETSRYMVGRTHINAAMENAFDKWGFFDGVDATDKNHAAAARKAFEAYLKRYPRGAYAASARGLIRRAHWLSGDMPALSRAYQALLSEASKPQAKADVIEEIDIKLLFEKGAAGAVRDPDLLAVINLMRMRDERFDGHTSRLTLADLEAQRSVFKGRGDQYDFLLASHALYVENNPRAVLKLIPDAARQPRFTALQFSRQALRGAALAALKDRNEGGFWRDMLGGAKGLYQRPHVELGLATFFEHNGQLDKVFAKGSPITQPYIREILLQRVAGPDILRRAASNTAAPRHERDVALFILLYKQLSRGDYAGFLNSQKMIPASADKTGGLFALHMQDQIPVGMFSDGRIDGEYDCALLRRNITALSRNPKDIDARLCLGDFWLTNGFDYYRAETPDVTYGRRDEEPTPALGSSESRFPGKAMPRHDIYTDIIANPRASSSQRAYALYRAIKCYATAGQNTCGGKGMAQAQRKAWFTTLKRQYPRSKWAKSLKYYW